MINITGLREMVKIYHVAIYCWCGFYIWDDVVPSLRHLQHSFFFSFSLYLLPDKGGGLYTAVPQTDPMECISCRNCRNNNRYVAVCLHGWLWIGTWLPLLFSLQQRKFLKFYLSHKISECGVLSLRLLLSFCPSFTIFTFLCFGFFRYIDNIDDFISHWDTLKRFDVFEIFKLVSFSAYRLCLFSPVLFSVEFFSMVCDIFYSIFWMRACLNVRGKTLCVW